jgi:predicted nucleotidyltransferase
VPESCIFQVAVSLISKSQSKMSKKTLLSIDYPDAEEWKKLVQQFSPEAVAHKLLLSSVPYVFRDEPLKYALFKRTIADAFHVAPTDVFIVGSALAGRSLKGHAIEKIYSSESDIDTLIISEHLFAKYVMKSFEWVKKATAPDYDEDVYKAPKLTDDEVKQIGRLSLNACKGIWRPDSLPSDAEAREEFFTKFGEVSLKTLGLQLSEDTVAKVNGRIARSFDDAVKDLSSSIRRLKWEFENIEKKQTKSAVVNGTPNKEKQAGNGVCLINCVIIIKQSVTKIGV